MISFKKFINKIKPIVVDVQPIHGSHSRKPIVVDVQPIHGSHSRKLVKEDTGGDPSYSDPSHSTIENMKKDSLYSAHHPLKLGHHLKEYTDDSYPVNSHLIKSAHKSTDISSKHKDAIHKIDNEINAHHMHHDTELYHGAGFNPNHYASKHPDRLIKMPAYTSASHSKYIAHEFSATAGARGDVRHIIKIHIKKGQKARYIGKQTAHSHNEYEHILPRNTVLKIGKKPHKYYHSGREHHVWDAHIHEQ